MAVGVPFVHFPSAKLQVSGINKLMVQRLLNSMSKNGLSANTLAKTKAILYSVFNEAKLVFEGLPFFMPKSTKDCMQKAKKLTPILTPIQRKRPA